MGWTSTYRAPGQTDRDYFANWLGAGDEIVECATVKGAFYAAVRRGEEVWCLVVLVHRNRSQDYNFTTKEMTDTMGPAVTDCPAKVLDALTPTDNQYALEWRADCRKRLAQQEKARQVRPGQVVKFAAPFSFTNGDTLDTFVFEKRNSFRGVESGLRYTIRGWRDRAFEVVV